jgi:hypothetical protein
MDSSVTDESRAAVPIAVVIVMLTATIGVVGTRVYTRGYMLHQFGMDDWASIVAVVCFSQPKTSYLTRTGHCHHGLD